MSFKDLLGIPKNNLGLSLPNTGEQWVVDTTGIFKFSAGFGTLGEYHARYRRRGDSLELYIRIKPGVVANTTASVSLGGLTIDPNKINKTAGGELFGLSMQGNSVLSAAGMPVAVWGDYNDLKNLYFCTNTISSTGFTANTVSNIYVTTAPVWIHVFSLPIFEWRE